MRASIMVALVLSGCMVPDRSENARPVPVVLATLKISTGEAEPKARVGNLMGDEITEVWVVINGNVVLGGYKGRIDRIGPGQVGEIRLRDLATDWGMRFNPSVFVVTQKDLCAKIGGQDARVMIDPGM